MGEEFYSILKLVSGEEIFSLISIDESGEDVIVILQNPLVMKMINSTKGSYIKVRKWIELSCEDIFLMKFDRILTMSESKDKRLISIYNNYIKDIDLNEDMIDLYTQSRGEVNISSDMGYISNVEDARKKFEVLFKINQEPKES